MDFKGFKENEATLKKKDLHRQPGPLRGSSSFFSALWAGEG